MDTIGHEILEEFGETAIYTPPGADAVPVSVVVVMRDRGSRARLGRGLVLTSDAVATVSDGLSFARGGTLKVAGTLYRIDEKQVGAPGLTELGLARLEGARVDRHDGLADDVISEFGQPVSIGGSTIQAHVVRTGVDREIRKGVVVEVVRTIATVRVADAPDVRPKDEVVMGGRVYSIRSTDRDGFGLVALTLDRGNG